MWMTPLEMSSCWGAGAPDTVNTHSHTSTHVLILPPLCRAPCLQMVGSSDSLLLLPLAPWVGLTCLANIPKTMAFKISRARLPRSSSCVFTSLSLDLILIHCLIQERYPAEISQKNPPLNLHKTLGANAHMLFKPVNYSYPREAQRLAGRPV